MKGNTAQQILDTAQDLVRQRGYSAFSYADIADQVGIRKASIHYHFASKEALVWELVRGYREVFGQRRQHIQQTTESPEQQLIHFARLYAAGLQQGQICLCGMLAADIAVLPEGVLAELQAFFAENEDWLAAVLTQGYGEGIWPHRSAVAEAKRVLATLQGAQLIARVAADGTATFDHLIESLLTSLGNHATPAP